MVLADRGHQPGPAHPVAYGTTDLRQPELDPGVVQVGVQRGQHVGRRHVEVGGGADVEDDGGRPVRPCADQGHDLVLGDIGVDEGERDVGPEHEEPGDRRGRRVAIRIGEDRRVAGHAAEHGEIRPAGAIEDGHQRQRDRDGHPGQGGREDHAAKGADRQQEVGSLPGPVASQLGQVDQAHDRGDHDRGQDRQRQVREDRGKDDRGGEDQGGRHQRRELGPVAGRFAGRGLAQAGIDREPTEQAGRGVRRAEGDELLVRVDRRSGAGPRRSARPRSIRRARGRRSRTRRSAGTRCRQSRSTAGSAAGCRWPTSPTTATPFSGRSSRLDSDDPHDERDERTRDARRDAPEGEDPDQRADPERGGVRVQLVQALGDLDQLLDDRAAHRRDPEQGRDLADGDGDRQPDDEAGHDRRREELREEAEPGGRRPPGG